MSSTAMNNAWLPTEHVRSANTVGNHTGGKQVSRGKQVVGYGKGNKFQGTSAHVVSKGKSIGKVVLPKKKKEKKDRKLQNSDEAAQEIVEPRLRSIVLTAGIPRTGKAVYSLLRKILKEYLVEHLYLAGEIALSDNSGSGGRKTIYAKDHDFAHDVIDTVHTKIYSADN